MEIQWLGHACFLITGQRGVRIVCDPHTPSERMRYGAIDEVADIVLVSHEHSDHNNVAAVKGNPRIVKGMGQHLAKGLAIQGIDAYHDMSQGSERGTNTVFVFTLDGVRLCHMGDLGHPLRPEQAKAVGRPDILFLPVGGGGRTVDGITANRICDELRPRVVLPVHSKTEKCDLPIFGPEDFLSLQRRVRHIRASVVEFDADHLPESRETVVLEAAR